MGAILITDEYLRSAEGEKALRALLKANFDKFRGPVVQVDHIDQVYARIRHAEAIEGRAMAVFSMPEQEAFYVNFVLTPDMAAVKSITHNMSMEP